MGGNKIRDDYTIGWVEKLPETNIETNKKVLSKKYFLSTYTPPKLNIEPENG